MNAPPTTFFLEKMTMTTREGRFEAIHATERRLKALVSHRKALYNAVMDNIEAFEEQTKNYNRTILD